MNQLCLLLLHISQIHDSFTYLKDICRNVFSRYFTVRLYSSLAQIVRFHETTLHTFQYFSSNLFEVLDKYAWDCVKVLHI